MLVISRKATEKVLIPGLNITITVLSIGANRVQLGIEAPDDVDITRPEATRPEHVRADVVVERSTGLAKLLV